jgi:acetyl esterase/lipase
VPLIVFALAAICVATVPQTKTPQKISFPTRDGWTIVAQFTPPKKGLPIIILAHGLGSSKGEWLAFSRHLATAGIGTFAIDLRGHLDSKNSFNGARGFETFDATNEWPKIVEDLNSAARWLSTHGVSPDLIAFGGASIGANLAALATIENPRSPFLLLLSPGADYHGVTLKLRRNLRALAVASPQDGYAFATLDALRKQAGINAYDAPFGHGVQMLDDQATRNHIIRWVQAASPAKR